MVFLELFLDKFYQIYDDFCQFRRIWTKLDYNLDLLLAVTKGYIKPFFN